MAGILITAYLVIGTLASALIWMTLIASTKGENRAKIVKGERLESNPLRERM